MGSSANLGRNIRQGPTVHFTRKKFEDQYPGSVVGRNERALGDTIECICHVPHWVSETAYHSVEENLTFTGVFSQFDPLLSIFMFRYYLPGDDYGSYENPFHSWSMLMTSPNIQVAL